MTYIQCFIWNMAYHNEIGRIGEGVASEFLQRKGMSVVERNYCRKWGEIDIVSCETSGKLHFVEVKSVSYETKSDLEWDVTHETWRPEERVDKNKQERLKRAIQTWLTERQYKGPFQIDIVVIHLVPREKYAKVKLLDTVVFV